MRQFWYFLLYSFLGFLLEIFYARCTRGRRDRKCLLLLPVCPVYGLGALAVLALPPWVLSQPPLLMLLGGAAATAVEYAMSFFYEACLGVSFWDYRDMPCNLHGRVCLPFSAAWCLLLPPALYWVHPWASRLIAAIPPPVTWAAMAAVGADLLVSAALMRRTGSRDCLRWYRRRSPPFPGAPRRFLFP